jgi:hypothetical protein
MPNLSRYATPIQQEFVTPHVKRGDYYLTINPHTGRRNWVYPRKMGEARYAVVSALGTDPVPAGQSFDLQTWLSAMNPTAFMNEVTGARQDLADSRIYMKIAIGASVVAAALTLLMFFRDR